MTSTLLPKRDLYTDSPEAEKLDGWAAGRLDGKTAGKLGGREAGKQNGGTAGRPARAGSSTEGGFTLIEVIAALVIVAVLAAMIFPVTRQGLEQTARGVGDCRVLFELQGQMEEIVATYKAQLAAAGGDIELVTFRDAVTGYSYVDAASTGFLDDSGTALDLTSDTSMPLFLVTLASGDQRIASVFSK